MDGQAEAADIDLVLPCGRNGTWVLARRHGAQRTAPWKSGPNPPSITLREPGAVVGCWSQWRRSCRSLPDRAATTARLPSTLPPIVTVSTTTTILITTTTVQSYYIVKRGDTLGKIAKAFQVRLADLQAINGITNADDIQAGQELQIPTGAVVYNTLPTPDTTPVTT